MNPLSLLAFTAAISVHTPDWLGEFLDGSRALEKGDAKAAKVALEQALADLPEHAATTWQLACACARLGELDAAFDWLEKCIAWGGGEVALLEWDPDLAALRKDPRFAKLVERQRARSANSSPALLGELLPNDAGKLSISPGAKIVLSQGSSTLLLDTRSHDIVGSLNRPGERIRTTSMSPNGQWVVVGSSTPPSPKKQLRVFSTDTGNLIAALEAFGDYPHLEFSGDSRYLLAFGGRGEEATSALWRTEEWSKLWMTPGPLRAGALSPDGTRAWLVTGESQTSADVSIWDLDSKRVIHRHKMLADVFTTWIRFSSDSQLALECWPQVSLVRVFDAHDGSLVRTLGAVDLNTIQSVSQFVDAIFLANRGEIAVLDKDQVITIYDARG